MSGDREKQLEHHIADGRQVVGDLIRKLGGAPGSDPMRALVLQDARKWLEQTSAVSR